MRARLAAGGSQLPAWRRAASPRRRARRSRMRTRALAPPGFTCSTLEVPLDHTGRTPGTLGLQVGAADNRDAPRGVLLVLLGGPGQPGLPILQRFVRVARRRRSQYRIVVFDQRGTGAGALDCPALQSAMGSSDLTPPAAVTVRAAPPSLGARARSSAPTTWSRTWRRSAARSAPTPGRSTGSRTARSSASDMRSRIRAACASSCSTRSCRRSARPISASTSSRRSARARGGLWRKAASPISPPSCTAYHLGPQLFDALTVLTASSTRPTGADWDVPAALHRRARGDSRCLDFFLAAAAVDQAGVPAQALDQGLHASALCADSRFPWGDSRSPLAGREANCRAGLTPAAGGALPVRRSDRVRQWLRPPVPALGPAPPTPLREGKLLVPTLLVNGDHDLSTPLAWARKQLALTPHGSWSSSPGAGHSVQSRAVSDAGRNAVAAFLLS